MVPDGDLEAPVGGQLVQADRLPGDGVLPLGVEGAAAHRSLLLAGLAPLGKEVAANWGNTVEVGSGSSVLQIVTFNCYGGLGNATFLRCHVPDQSSIPFKFLPQFSKDHIAIYCSCAEREGRTRVSPLNCLSRGALHPAPR